MRKTCDWLDLSEVKSAFAECGLAGADLVRVLAWAGARGRLVATGFRQISIGGEVDSEIDRKKLSSGHIWRYIQYAFHDGDSPFGASATILEADWVWSNFRYRIERIEKDRRPASEVACCIYWHGGSASYRLNDVQEVWESILVDAAMVRKMVAQIAERSDSNALQDWEIDAWIRTDCQTENSKDAWTGFKAEYGKRTGKKANFPSAWERVKGKRRRGRPAKTG